MEQLVDDVGLGCVDRAARSGQQGATKYNPRPDLVLPPVAPRRRPSCLRSTSVANRENNPNWGSNPRKARERLVAEADANADNPRYRSPLLAGYGTSGTMTETQKWQAFREARKLQKGAYLDQRRLLSDPPSVYRQADEATLTDSCEPEAKKEKRRKKMAKPAQQTARGGCPSISGSF